MFFSLPFYVVAGRLALDQDLATVLMEQLDDAEPDVLSRPLGPAAPGLDTIVSRRQSTSNGRGTPDSDGFGFSEFEGLEPLVPPEEAAAAALTEAAAAAAAAVTEVTEGVSSDALGAVGHHHHRSHRRSARSLGVPAVGVPQRPSMRLSDQDPGHHGLAALPAMTAAAVAAAAAARVQAGAASGVPAARICSYDVMGLPAASQQQAVGAGQTPTVVEDSGAAAQGGSGGASAALSRAESTSTGVAAAGSPRHSGTGASTTRSASGSLQDNSRRSSKRSIPSIFQAAAAVAAAAVKACGLAKARPYPIAQHLRHSLCTYAEHMFMVCQAWAALRTPCFIADHEQVTGLHCLHFKNFPLTTQNDSCPYYYTNHTPKLTPV